MVASLFVALLAISHDSLWIDEAFSARFAAPPDITGWWHTLKAGGPPDVEMPLYMFYLWAWEKLAGSSEWALRAANIPWFLVAQAAFWVGLRPWRRVQLAAVLCNACNPFLWRYLNEARPYAMQYAGAAMVVSCLAWLGASAAPVLGASWLLAAGTGLFLLCGSCALGVPWAGAAVLACLWLTLRRTRIKWTLASAAASLGSLLAFAGLSAYYGWTLSHLGIGGTMGFGHKIGSFCVAVYEILGFLGLGPSRISISDVHDAKIFFPYLATLVPLALLLAGSGRIAAPRFLHSADSRLISAALTYVLLPLSTLIAMVGLRDWHAVGRHFTPISPVIVLTLALAIAAAWREKSAWKIGWTTVLVLLWLVSSLEIRFDPRHRRDDYRDAVRVAHQALDHGKCVWWMASGVVGTYYHLPVAVAPQEAGALVLWRPVPGDLEKLPSPDVVFLTKPAIFDPDGIMAAYLEARHYHQSGEFPAFSIWRK